MSTLFKFLPFLFLLSNAQNCPTFNDHKNHRQCLPTVLKYFGSQVYLTPSSVDSSKGLIVHGYIVHMNGHFTMPGQTVLIRCHTLKGTATIDVSGNRGTSYSGHKASNGGTGQRGANGRNGGKGKDGGDITIVSSNIDGSFQLFAKGGDGGQGESGGNGGQGATGSTNNNCACTHSITGGRGYRGGDAGSPGRSGNGGDGGQIFVLVPNVTNQISAANAAGGKGASPPAAGTRGQGGYGGDHGLNNCYSYCCKRCLVWCCGRCRRCGNGRASGRGPSGPAGSSYNWGNYIHSANGLHGEVLLSYNKTIIEGVLSDHSPDWLQYILNEATTNYMKGSFNQGLAEFSFVCDMVRQFQNKSSVYVTMYAECTSQIFQISQGNDFYRRPINFVPRLTLDFYRKTFDRQIPLLTAIETAYNSFKSTSVTSQQKRKILESKHQQDKQDLTKMAKDIVECEKEQQLLSEELSKLVVDTMEARKAVESVTGSCSQAIHNKLEDDRVDREGKNMLNKIVSIVSTTISVASAVVPAYGIATAIGSTASNIFKSLPNAIDSWKNVKKLADDLQVMAGKAKDLTNSVVLNFKKTKEVVKDVKYLFGKKTFTEDLLKRKHEINRRLLVNGEEFRKVLQPWLNLDECRSAVHENEHFIEISRAKNDKETEVNLVLTSCLQKQSSLVLKEKQVRDLESSVATETDFSLIQYTNILKRDLLEVRQGVAETLRLYMLSANAKFLDNMHMELHDFSSTSMKTYISKIETRVTRRKENQDPRHSMTNGAVVVLLRRQMPHLFPTEGQQTFTFSIPGRTDVFLHMAHPLVTNVQISFPEMNKENIGGFLRSKRSRIIVTAMKAGSSITYDQEGHFRSFVHQPRRFTVDVDPLSQVQFNDENEELASDHEGVSPYGPWTFTFHTRHLNLSDINEIRMHFRGNYVPLVCGLKCPDRGSLAPTSAPTRGPSTTPSDAPTTIPTDVPTAFPTQSPTNVPTQFPTVTPTTAPSVSPTTGVPTKVPTTSSPIFANKREQLSEQTEEKNNTLVLGIILPILALCCCLLAIFVVKNFQEFKTCVWARLGPHDVVLEDSGVQETQSLQGEAV